MCYSRYKNTQFCNINIATPALFTGSLGFLQYLTRSLFEPYIHCISLGYTSSIPCSTEPCESGITDLQHLTNTCVQRDKDKCLSRQTLVFETTDACVCQTGVY